MIELKEMEKKLKVKVEISRSESMTRIFRNIAISTHKNVEISRAETIVLFSQHFFAFYKFVKEV